MVRLVVRIRLNFKIKSIEFQFQYGAIGRNDESLIWTYQTGFNSSMVRLMVGIHLKHVGHFARFQFQYGAIGS